MGCICGKNVEPKGKFHNPEPRITVPPSIPQEDPSMQESSVKQEYSSRLQLSFALSSNELWPDCKLYEFNGALETGQLSTHRAWQTLLLTQSEAALSKMYSAKASSNCLNTAVRTVEDRKMLVEIAGQLLNFNPRDWVGEYSHCMERVRLGQELEPMQTILQLQAHFQWLVWAAAAFFYVSMGSQANEIDLVGEFSSLSGTTPGLPSKVEDWMKGFFFKNVYFTLSFSNSELGRLVRAEMRTLKAFLIEIEDMELNTPFIAPLIVAAKIGPLILTGSAVYQGLGRLSTPIQVPLFGKGVELPPENVFALGREPQVLLLHSTYKLLPEVSRPRFLLHSSCVTSEIRVYKLRAATLTKLDLIKLISPESHIGSGDITSLRFSKYGWDFDIFYDSRSRITKKNRFAELLNATLEGDVAVSVQFQGPSYSRGLQLSRYELTESLNMSVKDCMSVLEHYDTVTNHSSLNELIRRKGLSSRHEWLLLSKLRDQRACDLIRTDLLARAVRKLVAFTCQSPEFTLSQYKHTLTDITERLLEAGHPLNEVYLMLFLSRLKVLEDAKHMHRHSESTHSRIVTTNSSKKINSFENLLSADILTEVCSAATRAPAFFLDALELHCGFEFKEEWLFKARNDRYSFVMREVQVEPAQVERLSIRLLEPLSLREESYLTLIKITKGKSKQQRRVLEDLDASDVSFSINEEKLDLAFEMPFPSSLYKHHQTNFLKNSYELPPLLALQNWTDISYVVFEGLVTVVGTECLAVEQTQWLFMRLYFDEKDLSSCKEQLDRSFKVLNRSLVVPAELVAAHYMLTGLVYEVQDAAVAEKYFTTAVLLMIKLSGDPRGRGCFGLPWVIPASWKIAKIAKDEGRHRDWHAAQELFEAAYASTRHFKQQLGQYSRGRPSSAKQEAFTISFPFTKVDSLQPANWELYFAWMQLHHIAGAKSQKTWSGLTMRLNISGTKLGRDVLFSMDTSSRSSKMSLQTGSGRRQTTQHGSLSQLLIPENGAVDRNSMEGVVYIWGSDKFGQLGLSITETYETLHYPRILSPLKDLVVKEIASWYEHCLAVTVDGLCYAWGNNEFGQLGLGPDAPAVLRYPMRITSLSGVMTAACGSQHSIAVTTEHQVYTMGQGEGGLLGHGNQSSQVYPKAVRQLKDNRVVGVCCGSFHSIARNKEGRLFVWGRNEGGQLGLDTSTFTQRRLELSVVDNFLTVPERLYGVLATKKIVQVACGEAHSLALTSDSQVYSWGWGGNGQLGNGLTSSDYQAGAGNLSSIVLEPVPVAGLPPIKQVSAAGLFSVFLTTEGQLWACGINDHGQLGQTNRKKKHEDICVPTLIESLGTNPIEYVNCGENHVLAFTHNSPKLLWTWGHAAEGKLGLGPNKAPNEPCIVQTMHDSDFFQAACGSVHSAVLIGAPTEPKAKGSSLKFRWNLSY
jgi:alpha-tubulin suppressor-like RCC1 family protein